MLPEWEAPRNIKAKGAFHWIDVLQVVFAFEFQFLVLARDQTSVAQTIRTQLKKFAKAGALNFHPTEILIYSTSNGETVGEFVTRGA